MGRAKRIRDDGEIRGVRVPRDVSMTGGIHGNAASFVPRTPPQEPAIGCATRRRQLGDERVVAGGEGGVQEGGRKIDRAGLARNVSESAPIDGNALANVIAAATDVGNVPCPAYPGGVYLCDKHI